MGVAADAIDAGWASVRRASADPLFFYPPGGYPWAMGLWCTVFGHDWGEPETERDRREEGEEVVVTVRELEICNRCGAEEVLGESVEVTAIEPAGAGDPGDPAREPHSSGPAREPHSGDRAHEPHSSGPAHEPGSTRDTPPAGDDSDADRYDDPATDDGVVLEGSDHGLAGPDGDAAGPAGVSRQPGEWPDRPNHEADDSGADGEPRPWPDPEAGRRRDDEPEADGWVDTLSGDETRESHDDLADEPADSGQAADDSGGESAADDSGGDQNVDEEIPGYGPGEPGGPESDDWESPVGGVFPGERPEDDAEVLDATEPNEQSRATAAEPADPDSDAVDSGSDAVVSDSDTEISAESSGAGGSDSDAGSSVTGSAEFGDESERVDAACYCPECGFVHDRANPSFRAGDVCPDCRRSYLAEREE